ncbi:MAG: hypothetical protein IKZ21_01945 [Clostridia bacterium]|nr:hypothetical protein [Clostridia bacterium]
MNIAKLIRRGNILTTDFPATGEVGRYLGNGRFGATLSATGLNLHPNRVNAQTAQFHFNHISHWGRFRFFSRHVEKDTSADYILPFFRIYWEKDPCLVTNYYQEHDFYDGVLRTEFTLPSGTEIRMESWFDGQNRDMMGITVNVTGDAGTVPCIVLSPFTKVDPCAYVCGQIYDQSVTFDAIESGWKLSVTCDTAVNDSRTDLYLSTNMDSRLCGTDLQLSLKPGQNVLLLSVNACADEVSPEHSLERTMDFWHNTWETTGWVEYPDPDKQTMWVRSMAYLLSSYDEESEFIQPANAMGINGFAYNFIPDMENVAPILLMTGHGDIVRHWVEILADEIDAMKRYTHRLWPEAEGIFPPWELNYGPIDGYHYPSVPIIFCYEAHNTGYLSRLATEVVEYTGDDDWAKEYAYPLIDECARFFRKFCFKEADSFWHLRWYPCMGRDEAGGVNKDDYLCTLITAKYSFQAAIRFGMDHHGEYQTILSEGLAFDPLLCERGTYHTCRGADDFGKQKHPVQLEGIACFPTETEPMPAERRAYELRYEITNGAKTPFFWGWTLAQLLLADTNMKNYEGWSHDWSLILPSDNMDKDRVQFYETSGSTHSSFYLVTHGMVIQSLLRNCVNDYWGKLEFASCLQAGESVRFGNILTKFGVSVSGQIENKKVFGKLTALRDCSFRMEDRDIELKSGETLDFTHLI